MNTSQLKTYAPKARLKVIEAIKTKLRTLGIEESKIVEVERSGDFIFIHKQPFPRQIESARQQIIQKIEKLDFEQVLEQYAYTWFNRLCAIRFMELHEGYLDHGYRVLSHSQRDQGLDFLDSALEVAEYFGLDSKEIIDLKLEHKDEQLYRKLLLAQCNQLHEAMPFLFDPIDSVTSLLLPDDLTRSDSIIADLVQQVDEESWQQVEIIGWLYQFYISELKDEVIGKVVATEDIPYATQLFTPNWIVKYMVQNSLGRYWLQTYQDTVVTIDGEEKRLKDVLEYYIEPAEQEDSVKAQLAEITPKSIDPISIKVIDPASGSGHILVEAYDLLKLIYQSQGHRERDIPKLILENNIFGLDVDDRAEQLTGFALMMKARQDDRRIFGRGIHLNICAFQNSDELDADQLWQALNLNQAWQAGSHVDMFGQTQADLGAEETDSRYALIQDIIIKFKDAKVFGSLLSVDQSHEAVLFDLKNTLNGLVVNGDSLQKGSAEKLLPIIEQAWILSQRYDAVIANPPYMGVKSMEQELKNFAKENFENSKTDLYAMFIEQSESLLSLKGCMALITMDSWLYGDDFTFLRSKIISKFTIFNMIHLGARAFPEIGGEVVQTAAFVASKRIVDNVKGIYCNLVEQKNSKDKENKFLSGDNRFISTLEKFNSLPRRIFSYSANEYEINAFKNGIALKEIAEAFTGLQTGDNPRFIKGWYELSFSSIRFGANIAEEMIGTKSRWVPYVKGSDFRKWYGNNSLVVDWYQDGFEIKKHKSSTVRNQHLYFKQGIAYNTIASNFSARFVEKGFIFDQKNSMFFPISEHNTYYTLGLVNSKVIKPFLNILSPKDFGPGSMKLIPVLNKIDSPKNHNTLVQELVELFKNDWNSCENSWEFKKLPLINNAKKNIKESYNKLRQINQENTLNAQALERKNNQIFIKAYNLEAKLEPEVPLKEITLTCNPSYRYGGEATKEQLEQRLRSDTIAELISYAIGCMMGRYSLDREGLVYAHTGNIGFDELVADGAYKTFPADDDGILPLLDEERFPDDVYSRFEQFISTAWDKETLYQNLDFIAESLCLYNIKSKNGESSAEIIRRYLSNHFYKDQHLKTYNSRPIYWLFSSGKQKAFECLVYMHRFNDVTLAKMRMQYVLPLMGQLTGRVQFLSEAESDTSLSPAEKTKYAKEADSLHKKLNELKDFDAELKHHIEQKISIDLDNGVKVNYGKFAKLLAEVKKVTGNKE